MIIVTYIYIYLGMILISGAIGMFIDHKTKEYLPGSVNILIMFLILSIQVLGYHFLNSVLCTQ